MRLKEHEEFRAYRTYLRVSQSELATKMGTTPNTVARWESGDWTITPMTMHHIRSLAEQKLRKDLQEAFALIAPELTLGEFEGLFAPVYATLTDDKHGKLYVGFLEIMGHRDHSLHFSIDEKAWFALSRDGTPTKVDKTFLRRLRAGAKKEGVQGKKGE